MFSARELAEWSSDPTLNVIQVLATMHWSEASAVGSAFVVRVCEAWQKFGHRCCHSLYAFVFRPGPVEAQELTQGVFAKLLLSG